MKKISVPAFTPAMYPIILGLLLLLSSCEEFLTPDFPNIARTDEIFRTWDEYRSAGMGLYALQQDLVDQLFILGEVRADMLILTDNSTADLEEVGNYEFNPNNEFMSPKGFYRLIAACNVLSGKIQENQSDLFGRLDSVAYKDLTEVEQNYVGLYGEVVCMRSWTYFNMVRIFGHVPYFPEDLSSEEELNNYVTSDPVGHLLDIYGIVDSLIVQLGENIIDDRIGANYNTEGINDDTWNVTSWNKWAYYSLIGQMHLSVNNYAKAIEYFEKIIYNNTEDFYFLNLKQHLAAGLREDRIGYMPGNNNYWTSMFKGFDLDEHILAVWFNKERKQQNRMQYFLSNSGVNIYALAPSRNAIHNWETQWHDATFVRDAFNPKDLYMVELGIPGDFVRGYGASYAYFRNGLMLPQEDVEAMLDLKRNGQFDALENLMSGVDTVVYKYSLGKDPYDLDSHYSIFRAGSVHLYYAEALNSYGRYRDAESVLNRGISSGDGTSVSGVRRRAYLALNATINTNPRQLTEEGIEILDIVHEHDPFTNKIIGFRDLSGAQEAKTYLRDSLIIRERALECAWEGERFYDLIRVAERYDDPSFLAKKVAAKYPADQREFVENLLMNKENWYIPYFKNLGN